jgi:hypothetical protein
MILELALVGIVLVIVGVAVYMGVNHKANPVISAKSTPRPSASPSPSPTSDPTAGWKTYNETYEDASYMYPPSWSFAVSHRPDGPTDVETDTLTSPAGLVLTFSSPIQGIGGACGALDDTKTTYVADNLSMANVSEPIYLVVDQLGSNSAILDRQIGLEEQAQAPELGSRASCDENFDLWTINSHGKDHELLSFGGGYPRGAQQNSLSSADYLKLPDVTNAQLILKSLTFATPE